MSLSTLRRTVLGRIPLAVAIVSTAIVSTVIVSTAPPASAGVLELVDQYVSAPPLRANSAALSQNGRFLYVGGYNGTHIFERDSATGELTFLEMGPDAESFALSPNGLRMYTALSSSGSLRVLRMNRGTGSVATIENWERLGFESFAPHGLVASPDGRHLYAVDNGRLAAFDIDAATGVLSWIESLYNQLDAERGLAQPEHLAISPDGSHVYVVDLGFGGPGSITALRRDEDSGKLSIVQTVNGDAPGITGLDDPKFVRVSHDGRQVFVVTTQGLLVLERNAGDGRLSLSQDLGVGGEALAESDDGRTVYVGSGGNLEIYSRSPESGLLQMVETYPIHADGLDRARAIEISADGRFVYVTSSAQLTASSLAGVAVYSRNVDTGLLSLVRVDLDEVDGDVEGLNSPSDGIVTPDGKNVYVVGRQFSGLGDIPFGEIAAFSRDESGGLEFDTVYYESDGIEGLVSPLAMTVSPDGRNLYIVCSDSLQSQIHSLVVMGRDADGTLQYLETHYDNVGGVNRLEGARSVAVSPDGQHVLVAATRDDAVTVFERDVSTGSLTFVADYRDGLGGIDGLNAANSVSLDPSGEHVYVYGTFDNAVALFDRDASTGELTFVEAVESDELTQGGIPRSIVSQDGRNLYLAAGYTLVVFHRAANGQLTYLESHYAPNTDPVLSPDDAFLFDFSQGSATVYTRDSATGSLTRVESEPMPAGATSTAISPDGGNVYVSARTSDVDTMLAYRTQVGTCREGFDGLCLGDRFRVELDWRDFDGNTGKGLPVSTESDDSVTLWFFGEDNWEMQLKILDACGFNDRFWVFAAATTNVEYTLRVTDALTGASRSYFNPLGNAAAAITDTDAFATCGAGEMADGKTADGSVAHGSMDSLVSLDASGQPVVRTASVTDLADVAGKSDGSSLFVGLGDKCLDIEGGLGPDGTPVILYDCHRKANQRWWTTTYCSSVGGCEPGFEIRNPDGQCLQPETSPVSGTQLVVGPCDGPEDRWTATGYLPVEASLVHMESGLCADVLGASSSNFTPIVLHPCTGGENQLWRREEIRCDSGPIGTCKGGDQFYVEVEWRDFDGKTGKGRVVPQESDDSGLFWFFGPDNWEMLVKVLDGCDLNDRHWVFAAASTNVEYTLRVTEVETGEVREYFNPLGNAAPAITDTSAFDCAEP